MKGKKIIPLSQPYFPETIRSAIARDIEAILASGRLMSGPWAKKFEERFADLTAREHAVSVNSCTTALQIALTFAGVSGRDVLVPAGSFITDVSAVRFAGGRPVLVNINADTLALDLEDLKRKVSSQTRAMIWVHLTGAIAPNHAEILGFCRAYDLFLIEDASHAHGAAIDKRPAGSFGDVSCFSFYPTKIVTSGTGGMLTTNNDALARFAREMRIFGKEEGTGEIIHHGNDWFLDEIRACVGFHHVSDIEAQVGHRRKIGEKYAGFLANQPGIKLLDVPRGSQPAWYQFPVFLADTIDREKVMGTLRNNHGIEAKGIYKATHREQIFRDLDDGSLNITEDILNRSLCLPMHSGIDDDDVELIARALVSTVRAQSG